MIGEITQVDQFAFLVAFDRFCHRQAKRFRLLSPMILHPLQKCQNLFRHLCL